jgi:hypothetical protein
VLLSLSVEAEGPTAGEVEFFEKNIRPVLADSCYRCHGERPEKLKAGLNLAHRAGVLAGGESGPALVAGDTSKSLILEALSYENEDLQMPPKEKLSEEVIAHFREWVEMGAPDPRVDGASSGSLDDADTWAVVREKRKDWWSFQPIATEEIPEVAAAEWNEHPIDRFIKSELDSAGLAPAPVADSRALIRRLSYVLTGLPPTMDEVEAFVAAAEEGRQSAVEARVDRALASERFGERWARHWMDWIRYAESHGSEGDPKIPYAWRYRDYLIRAFNADVPYDQLVREHLAGDQISSPRMNEELGINESILGTAQYRLVQHGFSPTDALDEQVRFTENQIDVVSKAFLGVTVSCARCHNHKFDAISQTDFYAMYGVMASSRPAIMTIDSQVRQDMHKEELGRLKPKFRDVLAKAWKKSAGDTAANLLAPAGDWEEALKEKKERRRGKRYRKEEEEEDKALLTGRGGRSVISKRDPLYVWRHLRDLKGEEFSAAWKELCAEWQASQEQVALRKTSTYSARWDLTGDDVSSWYTHGNGITDGPSSAGEFNILPEGEQIVGNILPAGMYSHTLSDKHSAVLMSPRFPSDAGKVFVRMIGNDGAAGRYVVQNYPHGGGIYPVTRLEDGKWHWQQWGAEYWDTDHLYIELATAADQPGKARTDQERSWFGISEALVITDGQFEPKDELAEFISPLFEMAGAPGSLEELATRYAKALEGSVTRWNAGTMSDSDARFLDYFVTSKLLPNTVEEVRGTKKLLAKYRGHEEEIPVPTRAPGVLEGTIFDQPFFPRGNHKQPGTPVARRFLEALDDTPYTSENAGRMALAESILDSDNPLTARVIVNRLWHHVFGRGLVATPDNFGKLGELPSHPALLDYLATRFVEEGWSIKEMVRFIATSRTFQSSAAPSAEAERLDPSNRLLSHSNLRRLEAEAIRDSLLMVAGRIDLTPFGEPVGGETNRRSVYIRVIRNRLDPFLTVFDAPVPISTMGRRNVTNVPAQALVMMNGAFASDLAGDFAARVIEEKGGATVEERISRLFELALGRFPSSDEVMLARSFIAESSDERERMENEARVAGEIERRRTRIAELASLIGGDEAEAEKKEEEAEQRKREIERLEREVERLESGAGNPDSWQELARAIFCMKEFIYLM